MDSIKRLYTANFVNYKRDMQERYALNREVGFQVIDNGIILPARPKPNFYIQEGGVCTADLEFVRGAFARLRHD